MALPAHLYRIQHSANSATALAKDIVVCTMHFYKSEGTGIPTTSEFNAVAAAWHTLVTTAVPLSITLTGVSTYKIYDLSDPEPRVPVQSGTNAAFTPGTTTMPRETALVISWTPKVFASGIKHSRQRGRTYIGPLASTTVADGTTGRPASTKVTDAATAAAAFLTAMQAIGDGSMEPVIYSAGVGSRKPDGTYRPGWEPFVSTIQSGWVDDEWDTQRRRGGRATTRVTFGPIPP